MAIEAETRHQLRGEAQARKTNREIEGRAAGEILDVAGCKLDRVDDAVADADGGRYRGHRQRALTRPSGTLSHPADGRGGTWRSNWHISLQIGVAVQHRL